MRRVLDTGGTGIDEEIAIELPDAFDSFTPDQRRAWAAAEIDAIALEMLADLGAMPGVVPAPREQAAFMRSIRRCVDGVLRGISADGPGAMLAPMPLAPCHRRAAYAGDEQRDSQHLDQRRDGDGHPTHSNVAGRVGVEHGEEPGEEGDSARDERHRRDQEQPHPVAPFGMQHRDHQQQQNANNRKRQYHRSALSPFRLTEHRHYAPLDAAGHRANAVPNCQTGD